MGIGIIFGFIVILASFHYGSLSGIPNNDYSRVVLGIPYCGKVPYKVQDLVFVYRA